MDTTDFFRHEIPAVSDIIVAQLAEGVAEGVSACSTKAKTEDFEVSVTTSQVLLKREEEFENPYRSV